MEHILVTGGAGFIGSNACNILRGSGYAVTAFDNLDLGRVANLEAGVRFVEGDVGNRGDLDRVGAIDHIIHLAGSSSSPMFMTDLSGSMRNNILGHVNVLEFARAQNVKKVLFASTSSVYGNARTPLREEQALAPPNFYAVSKHCMEELSTVYAAAYGTEIIGFRFMSIYGLHEEHKGRFANLVSQFIWGIEQGKRPAVYGDGSATRDFTNVRDVVAAFLLAIRSPRRFGATMFNVGTSEIVAVRDLVALINACMGTRLAPVFLENPVKVGYVQAQQADLAKIGRELGFAPTVDLATGIREIVAARARHPVPPASLSF